MASKLTIEAQKYVILRQFVNGYVIFVRPRTAEDHSIAITTHTMKNILVPTDFSENANKALDVAMALAQRFKATLHLVHTYHVSSPTGHMTNVNRVVREDREQEMEAFLTKIKADAPAEVVVQGVCRHGYAVETIEREAERVAADLLVMGTLGASNIRKQVWGSTASNLVKSNKVPVLAIPFETHYQDLQNMILAVDALDLQVLNTLNPALSLVQSSRLTLELLHVTKSDQDSDIDHSIEDYLKNMAIPFTYHKVVSDNILEGILNFARTQPKSVLCLVSHQRGWFENLFHSSVSQQVALQSDLPVLILPGKKS
jgi:nucleotide-binding universal stress UspA family protein